MCNSTTESIQHLISGCSVLAQTEYLRRHNLTAGIIHQQLGKISGLLVNQEPYYKYIPYPVLENTDYRLYWDTTIITDKTVAANRPDIVLINKKSKIAYLIDIAHPLDTNLEKTEREKINKYYDLSQEIKSINRLTSVYIIPIVISATGLITKKLPVYLKQINISNDTVVLMQKSVLLETSRIVRKVLNM